MAALVKVVLSEKRIKGVTFFGPTKVADASETDLSTPDTSIEFETKGLRELHARLKFAGYTAVTLKWQESFDDGATYQDIVNATTAATATIISLVKYLRDATDKIGLLRAPKVRLSIAGTLSAGADTLDVWVYGERF